MSKPKLLLTAHRHPWLFEPRGGEISVRTILNHLKKDFEVEVVVKDCPESGTGWFDDMRVYCCGADSFKYFNTHILDSDIVLTWATAAPLTAQLCKEHDVPYVLMVRWWRNIQPLPAGDLMTRGADVRFIRENQYIFSGAHDIFTNNDYARRVIKRFYNVEAKVSYVPISGSFEQGGDKDGHLLLVTPNKGVGEEEFLRKLAKEMPKQDIVVVNTPESMKFTEPNIISVPYVHDMSAIYKSASIVLMPVYHNDICGFTRVTMEAMRHGVPVIATGRNGMEEIVPNIVYEPEGGNIDIWVAQIKLVKENYAFQQEHAKQIFEDYNSVAEMDKFKESLLNAIKNAG